ncbi:hypothetical protein GIB67_015528 [Kingdonia uniflora]|uniref:Uncharacterized protein n=1 Tax=Kingdonia uniflora TaxID=39325 RepID=A0A7J7LA84_9MAGN|nr:hypothetical protein GIB67_015528 [Kingdonia uniflora]
MSSCPSPSSPPSPVPIFTPFSYFYKICGHKQVKRRGCACTKDDFLPEESFQSWGNYRKAWSQVGSRLKDRLLTRSLEDIELNEVKGRSQHEMKKTLNWWDLMWFGIGTVIGAGGSFAYLRVELGDFVAFIAAGNILLKYVIGGAAVALLWISYFATLCNKQPNDFRIITHNLSKDYNHLDPIAVGVIIVICILAMLSTKGSSRFNYIASIFHVAVILFILIAGVTMVKMVNYTDFAPFGVQGVFKASSVLFFAYVGFDAVSTMAEETKDPGRDIPIGLIASMSVTTLAYCLLAVVLCLMQPYSKIDPDAPFSIAFSAVGMDWAKYVVAARALKGMTTVLLVGAVGQARYLTHIARTHMVPPWLANVNEKTGTPVNATVVMLVATAIIGFFTNLNILSNLLSISTLFIFILVALALLVRRYYKSGTTTPTDRNKFIACLTLILGSSIATAVYWALREDGWILIFKNTHMPLLILFNTIIKEIKAKISCKDIELADTPSNRQLIGRWNVNAQFRMKVPQYCKWKPGPSDFLVVNTDGSYSNGQGGC